MAAALLTQLAQDWTTLAADPTTARTLATWRATDPTLDTLPPNATVDTLRELAHDRADPATADRILAALARRAPTEPLAVRAPSTRRARIALWWAAPTAAVWWIWWRLRWSATSAAVWRLRISSAATVWRVWWWVWWAAPAAAV